MKGRAVMYAAGLVLIGVGLRGVVVDADVGVAGWAVWFAGAVVAHDAVLVPVVLAAGVATGRLPAAWRRPVRAALIAGGCVSLVSLPLVLGYGRRADVPSQLPLPYGRNLAVVLAVIAVAAVLAGAVRAGAARRAGRRVRLRGSGRRARKAPRRGDGGTRG
ncbi:hypothetical protein AGRA3207_000375 [Actinomadura graeca]|uniref:Uncharacterized protein n=1 Tax=Actinomadura graeca TaxID=2750812 RepID=A0ABX8QMA5_9ACTN|nr:hypothetical protein [Actinomadura graeca]QXJ19783.1 hypothetical protein AGRA3207_000375 [Actinomadura graeca]